MSSAGKDPLGEIILDYAKDGVERQIIVESDICDDDVINASYLLRSYEEMPDIEQIALSECKGKVLDVGAGAGIHAKHLQELGLEVASIDISSGAVKYMQSNGLHAEQANFFQTKGQYDTLLMLMNGIGISGSLDNLERTLLHAKGMIKENGQLLCDSTDIKYLYMDEDGSMWVDLSTTYYGNFRFKMHYSDQSTDWFDWLYVDFENLKKAANKLNLKVEKLHEEEYHFLARITHNV